MFKPKYTNEIQAYGTKKQGMEYFKCSEHTLMKLARANKCIIHVGTRNIRINILKLAKCLEMEG